MWKSVERFIRNFSSEPRKLVLVEEAHEQLVFPVVAVRLLPLP
jgi:hypothetical protein